MRNILTQHGIPATNLSDASDFLDAATNGTVNAFISEFGLNLSGDDARTAATFAAEAILRGAESVDKVVGYIAKRMTGMSVSPAPRAYTMVMTGGESVDTSEVAIVPVVMVSEEGEPAPVVVVKGGRGRKRLGNSDFDAVLNIIKANAGAERSTIMDCIIATGIKRSSAVVYLWRYKNGER